LLLRHLNGVYKVLSQTVPDGVKSDQVIEMEVYLRPLLSQVDSSLADEWERMREGTQGDAINPWGVALFGTLRTVQPRTASQQSAYDKWLDQTSTREEARRDRIHGAVGVIPTPLWIVLFFTAGVIFVFMLFFADSGEGAVTQGVLMGTVVSVIVAMLLLLQFLDNPFHAGVGGLRPVAMERSLRIVDEALSAVGAEQALPCDAEGTPR